MTDQEHEVLKSAQPVGFTPVKGKLDVQTAYKEWNAIAKAGRKVYYGSKEVVKIVKPFSGCYALFYKLGLGKEVKESTKLEIS